MDTTQNVGVRVMWPLCSSCQPVKCDEDKTVDEAEHFRGEFVAVTFGVAPSALSHPKKRCVVQKVLP